MKKILFCDPMSRKNLGVYDKNILENLAGEKYFFASKGFQFDEVYNTNVIYNYNYYEKRGILKILSYCISQVRLVKWVARHKPDILHIQWIRLPVLDIIVIFFIKFLHENISIVYTAHNSLPHNVNGKVYIYLYSVLYHLFKGIIVHTSRTKKELVDLFGINGDIVMEIPHGIIKYDVNIMAERMYQNKIVFSMTGMMSYYKGVDILIDAWLSTKVLLDNNNIHLVIAGAGDIPSEKVPENCNMTIINRMLTDEEYQNIIVNTDVGILPYRKISQSGVLLSLLAEHKPVIVSDCGGLTQPFAVGEVGWIITDLSTQSLSEMIINVISDEKKIRRIQNNDTLWGKIDNYYSWKNIGRMTMDFYTSLVK